ncbi:MAG: hypothetical protein KJ958_00160, partial [Gammaproteobacteria bacterium]|nr:hypothetical protein [Gammaproteobacteria bacterium]
MNKAIVVKKVLYALAALCLVVGMLPMTGITSVFADESEQPAAAPAAGESGEAETPVEEAPTESETAPGEETPAPTGEEVILPEATATPLETEVAVTEVPTEEALVEEAADENSAEAPEAQSAPAEETLAEVVEFLNEEGIVLADEAGDELALSSTEAAEVLATSDPFFWNPTTSQWEGYTVDGTGCPANVACFADPSPFQAAVNAAPAGSAIYVAQDTYDEDVTINTQNLSFVGFSSITVADASTYAVPTLVSGYAVVKSLTLNADFGTTLGVYADEVIVNAGGKLNDGLSLVNAGGTVEASVNLVSVGSGGY